MFVRISPYPSKSSRRPRQEVVRIHRYDTWSLDVTLAKVIAPSLAALRKQADGGYPASMESAEQWDEAVAKMQRAFELIASDYEMGLVDETIPTVADFNTPIPDEAMAEYRRRLDALDAEITEGLDLFAKYYRSLWT